jgi:hypothetical protein
MLYNKSNIHYQDNTSNLGLFVPIITSKIFKVASIF